jgi:predicted unusual protein kinase regulating ubiquinone biosynthesis (AarF/ABC1/UbiB family)
MADRPATRGKRFVKLAGMTASVFGRYAKTKVKSMFLSDEEAELERRLAHELSGGHIAKTLGELKGAVMKVGQMVSIASDVLPSELADALRALQREAPPMSYEVIAEQVERELGLPPERLFRRFDPAPFAAASIGQVHRAVLDDGREVVCKVQYPGVDEAIDSDLAHLRLALRASMLAISRSALNAAFAELRTRLHEELDYCIEADNVRLFGDFHRSRHSFVVIPEVVGERSSQRVLTLTYAGGDTLNDVATRYSRAERDRIGEHLLQIVASQVFEFGVIHGDPHPGNFAFHPDGTLVVYDFGCIKTLPRETVTGCRDLLEASLVEDYAAVDEALLRLGVRRPGAPPVDASFYKPMRDMVYDALLAPDFVDFGRSAGLRRKVLEQLPAAARHVTSFQPAKHLIFLDRMLAGHYANLRTIGCRLPIRARLRAALDRFDADHLRTTASAPA